MKVASSTTTLTLMLSSKRCAYKPTFIFITPAIIMEAFERNRL
jgi:hypothetical protein